MMDETAGKPGPETAAWPARVIVIEDDQRLREYAIAALAGAAEIAVIGEAATLAEGLELVNLLPDLVLLDLGLPDGSGIAVIEEVRARVPLCRILVFTVFEDRASVLGTLKAGADGYILKDTSAEMVLGHVRAVLAGETPISARAAGHLLTLVRDDPPPASPELAKDVPHLSPRERELLEYLARGLSRKEVARLMELSPYTVAEYMQGIYRKLQVRSRGEAVFEAVQAQLIKLDGS
jgi:DNA-binding NarL/FixJ family response regulator